MDESDSTEEIARRVDAGEPDAMFAMALTRLHGIDRQQDLAATHALLRQAASNGHAVAARVRAHLTAGGVGVPADFAKAQRLLTKIANRDANAAGQLAMLKHVPDPSEFRRHVANTSPDVILIERLLAPEECQYLVSASEPRLKPATIGNLTSGGARRHPVRTSYDYGFVPGEEDLVVNRINRRIARVTGTRYEWGEPLQVLRYTPGQEYKRHFDTISGAANQRFWTALVYLNDGYRGGETDFPRLDVRIEGAMGDALLFCSLDSQGRPDPLTEHAGLPVTSGTKRLATRWIRQARYDPWEGQ